MNRITDNDLREALRRRGASRAPVDVPDDFCDRVMQEIENKHLRRMWLYPVLAVACSLLLLLTVYLGQTDNGTQLSVKDESIISEHQEQMTVSLIDRETKMEGGVVNRKKNAQNETSSVKPVKRKVRKPPVMEDKDSLNRLSLKIENELEQVADSIYMDRLYRAICSDPQLSEQLENFCGIDTASVTVFIKII
jgi:hypothetical protein